MLVARGQGVTLVTVRHHAAEPAHDRVLHDDRIRREPVAAKVGGPQVLRFFLLATAFAIVQNLVGIAHRDRLRPAPAVRRPRRLGDAHGRARDRPRVRAAVRGGGRRRRVLGRGRGRDRRHRRRRARRRSGRHAPHRARPHSDAAARRATGPSTSRSSRPKSRRPCTPRHDDDDAWPIVRNLVALLVAMWIGSWVSKGFAALGMTLPAYIGAMLVAAAIRNVDDVTGWFGLSHRFINTFGVVSLIAVPRDGADDAQALGARRARAAARRDPRRAGRRRGAGRDGPGLPADGPQLRVGGDERRVHRLHARHDRERDGRHARAGRSATARRRARSWWRRSSARSSSTSPTRSSSRCSSTCLPSGQAAAGCRVRATSRPAPAARRPSRRDADSGARRDSRSGRRPRG